MPTSVRGCVRGYLHEPGVACVRAACLMRVLICAEILINQDLGGGSGGGRRKQSNSFTGQTCRQLWTHAPVDDTDVHI
ncbi:hypothetical protein GCM10009794_13350 [Rothia terrae]